MAVDPYFERFRRKPYQADTLVWEPEIGMGYYPVRPADEPYDETYFQKYAAYDASDMGRALNAARADFICSCYTGPVLDVGIGAGGFINTYGDAYGYDVNPAGVDWLEQRGLFADPFARVHPSMTFWDSLEHVEEPARFFKHADNWVFVSMPIYENEVGVLQSKHFRPDEHRWYWTSSGFCRWVRYQGFRVTKMANFETKLGREDITTFACLRSKG